MQRVFLLFTLLIFFRAFAGELRIICTSDIHGETQNLAALGKVIKLASDEKSNVIICDLGDISSGNFYSSQDGGITIIKAFNHLRYDFRIPGNHDFELAPENFRQQIVNFNGQTLGADWEYDGIRGIPYRIVKFDQLSCAVIGLSDPKMPQRIMPDFPGKFHNQKNVLRETLQEIQTASPDIIILLWHSGQTSHYGHLKKFLRDFPEIDLVIGAHSHQEYCGEQINKTWFVQAGSHAQAAGVIDIAVNDENGEIIKISSKLIRPAQNDAKQNADETLQNLHDALIKKETSNANTVIRSGDEVIAGISPLDYNAPWGKTIAAAAKNCGQSDVGLSSSLPCPPLNGPLTALKLFTRLPYNNQLYLLKITKQQCLEAIRNEIARNKKHGIPVFCAGRECKIVNGKVINTGRKENVTLTVNSYIITANKTLKRLINENKIKFQKLKLTEREAVKKFLSAE